MSDKKDQPTEDILLTFSNLWDNNPKLIQILNQLDFSGINKIDPKKEFVKTDKLRDDVYFSELFTGLKPNQLEQVFYQAAHWMNKQEIQFILNSWRLKEDRFLQLKTERDEAIKAKEKAEELSLKVSRQLKGFKQKFQGRAQRDLYFNLAGFRPIIHLLLVGIDDYPKERADLRGCVKDVKDIEVVFKNQEGGFYEKVNTHLLINEAATVENIIAKTKEIIETAKTLDYVFIYFSGHASTEDLDKDGDKDGFFCAYPTSGKTVRDQNSDEKFYASLLGEDICDLLMSVEATVLLFCDFCHGGSFIQPLIDANNSTEVNRMTHNVFAMSACQADETAGETSDGGFFSQAVKRCFETQEADLDNNGVIYLDEIYQYVLKEVTSRRKNQNPVVCIPTTMVNIPILQFGETFSLPKKEMALTGHIEDDHVIESILNSMLPPEAYDLFEKMSFNEIIDYEASFADLLILNIPFSSSIAALGDT